MPSPSTASLLYRTSDFPWGAENCFIADMADVDLAQPRWWTRFRTWPSWAQAAAWLLLTPLPLLLLAASSRRWLSRAFAMFVTILVAVIWLAAARLIVSAWHLEPPRSWSPRARAVASIFLAAASAMLFAARPTRWPTRAVLTLVGLIWLSAAVLVAMPTSAPAVTDFISERLQRLSIAMGVVLAALGLLYGIVFVLPPRLVPARPTLSDEQLLKSRNDARSGLLAALGGAVALAGAFTGGYVGLKQLQVNREGQITERFTRAIDQLGRQELDVRLGGIYALERIARDSKADHNPIMEILTTFVRQHAAPSHRTPGLLEPRVDLGSCAHLIHLIQESSGEIRRPRLESDLQAVLSVLGRRIGAHDKPGLVLDLSRADIHLTDLRHANLQRAYLYAADLQEANLDSADMQGADLYSADLHGATLVDADLEGANLELADLRQVNLDGADLQKAFLNSAELQCAVLQADLRGASLYDADLQEATLGDADLRGANLYSADLRGTDLHEANLGEAELRGARADGDTRWPSGFDPVAAGVVMYQ
jgi:uncharacterized protein YjbI with pentapeptide repeats